MLYAAEDANGNRDFLLLTPLASSVEEEMGKHGFVVCYPSDATKVQAEFEAALSNSASVDFVALVFAHADMSKPIRVENAQTIVAGAPNGTNGAAV